MHSMHINLRLVSSVHTPCALGDLLMLLAVIALRCQGHTH